MNLGHLPKTHSRGKDAQTNVLAGAPTSVQRRYIYFGELQFWDRLQGCDGKASFDNTNDVVKSIDNGTCDNERNASLFVITCLQKNSQLCNQKGYRHPQQTAIQPMRQRVSQKRGCKTSSGRTLLRENQGDRSSIEQRCPSESLVLQYALRCFPPMSICILQMNDRNDQR